MSTEVAKAKRIFMITAVVGPVLFGIPLLIVLIKIIAGLTAPKLSVLIEYRNPSKPLWEGQFVADSALALALASLVEGQPVTVSALADCRNMPMWDLCIIAPNP